MKKILLGLGTIAAVAAPVATVVACGDSTKEFKIDFTNDKDAVSITNTLKAIAKNTQTVTGGSVDKVTLILKNGNAEKKLVLQKPSNEENASAQIKKFSDDVVEFLKTMFTQKGIPFDPTIMSALQN